MAQTLKCELLNVRMSRKRTVEASPLLAGADLQTTRAVYVIEVSAMPLLLRTVANVAAGLLAFYGLECAYIWMQIDVAPCDMSLASFVAAIGFVPQAVALPCAAWLLRRLRGRLRRTQIVVMNLLTLISSCKLIPWAQSADDRYTFTIDARMELLGRDLNNHVFVNMGFLIGCLMLSHFLLRAFRSRQPSNRPQADTGKEPVAQPETSLS